MRKRHLVALVVAGQLGAELREGTILKLTAQDPANAELSRPAYDGFDEVLPSGTKLKLTGARVWKERTVGRKRHIVIQEAVLPGGQAFPATVLRVSRGVTWLRVDREVPLPSKAALPQLKTVTIPAGTKVNAVLVTRVHSGLSKNDDALRAVLRQPLLVDGQAMLPAGSELDGKVVNVKPSRWLHRAGRVRSNFHRRDLGARSG